MLDAVSVIHDPERFRRDDVLLHCPDHATDAPWVGDVRRAWAWSDAKRPLTEYVERPTSALIDAVFLLGCEVAARDAEEREERRAAGAG